MKLNFTPKTQDGQASHRRDFAVIFVLGAPGAGKGTLCTNLAQAHNLSHYSVGDSLRTWMKANLGTPLANTIQHKLSHQGFLDSEDLNPFICQAIKDSMAINSVKGILIDGFPRCAEQAQTWREWPFQGDLLLCGQKPDVVLSFNVSKAEARARYLARARDSNDSAQKFERRFEEYEKETLPVEKGYRESGVLIDVDVNGTKEENVEELTRKLNQSVLWINAVIEQENASSYFLVGKEHGT